MYSFKLIYFVIFIITLYKTDAQISDLRLCVDKECTVPVSKAKTLLRYPSSDARILSFAANEDITIYSKSAGTREDLWGAELRGKRGYVPRHMVRETKILNKPTQLVPTELNNESQQVPLQVEPGKVQEPYEIVDGTKIYLSPQEDIQPSSTEIPLQSTVLPETVETASVEKIEEIVPITDTKETVETASVEKIEEIVPITDTANQESNVSVSVETNEEVVPITDAKETVQEETNVVFEPVEQNEQVLTAAGTRETENQELNISESVEKSEEVATKDAVNQETNVQAKQEETSEDKGEDIVEVNVNKSEEIQQNVELSQTSKSEEIESVTENISVDLPNTSAEENSLIPDDFNLYAPIRKEENKTEEAAVIPDTTTLIPEIDVPEPFVNNFEEVTQDPNQVVPDVNVVQTLTNDSYEAVNSEENVDEPVNQESLEAEPVTEENLESEHVPQEDISQDSSAEAVYTLEPEQSKEYDTKTDETISNEVLSEKEPENLPSDGALNVEEADASEESGFFAGLMSWFGSDAKENEIQENIDFPQVPEQIKVDETMHKEETMNDPPENSVMDLLSFNSDKFIYLVTTSISVIIFLLGYMALDKSKREGPLIAKINKLEKELLVIVKENQILQEKISGDSGVETNGHVSNELIENLKQDLLEVTARKSALEEQVQSLEKELENSTEVGLELNRMLAEMINSESGSDVLKANVEHFQRQLVEQQSTINSINETLAITNTENHELRLELELSNKKVLDLQAELDKLLLNMLKIEEEKETQQAGLESEITQLRQKCEEVCGKLKQKEDEYNFEAKQLKTRSDQAERKLELKIKEFELLKDTLKELKLAKNSQTTIQSLLEVGNIKAEFEVLKKENKKLLEQLQQEQELKSSFEKRAHSAIEENSLLKVKYDEADKLRVEAQTKLEVLSNYFKDREAQWQKEISKHEALWAEREGEATSTTERIKFMQEQLQNYKAQTESLKQEIMSQEIELKSQISVLEKKAHENWVSARQAERKLEESKQEAAQLRHRLTLRERAIQEDKTQHRLQSPIEQNGDMLESPASPPLLFGARDHITKSPPLPGLPPFLPPPPGVPFMPPPLHGVPFIPPPPPNMFPGDHRPPPLGRMSSPPLNSRYSPSSRGYSPYDRNSSSPSDSEYGTSPPPRRGYSPFNSRGDDRRDYKRPAQGRSNGRNVVKGGSSGSGHSNESLEKVNRQQSKV